MSTCPDFFLLPPQRSSHASLSVCVCVCVFACLSSRDVMGSIGLRSLGGLGESGGDGHEEEIELAGTPGMNEGLLATKLPTCMQNN